MGPGHPFRLPRLRLRNSGRPSPHETARRRDDRADRVGFGLSIDPAAGALLRREICDPGLHGFAAHGTGPRWERSPAHDVATARRQHPAILVVAHPYAPPPPTG